MPEVSPSHPPGGATGAALWVDHGVQGGAGALRLSASGALGGDHAAAPDAVGNTVPVMGQRHGLRRGSGCSAAWRHDRSPTAGGPGRPTAGVTTVSNRPAVRRRGCSSSPRVIVAVVFFVLLLAGVPGPDTATAWGRQAFRPRGSRHRSRRHRAKIRKHLIGGVREMSDSNSIRDTLQRICAPGKLPRTQPALTLDGEKPTLSVYIMCATAAGYTERQQAWRPRIRSFIKRAEKAWPDIVIDYKMYIVTPTKPELLKKMEDEHQRYGDVVMLDGLPELYSHLLPKTLAMLTHAVKQGTRYDVVMKVDDDTFVFWERAINLILGVEPAGWSTLYLGKRNTGRILRNAESANYEPLLPGLQAYPEYMEGPMYVLGWDVVETLFLWCRVGLPLRNEDAGVGQWLEDTDMKLTVVDTGARMANLRWDWCSGPDIALLHWNNITGIAREARVAYRPSKSICHPVARRVERMGLGSHYLGHGAQAHRRGMVTVIVTDTVDGKLRSSIRKQMRGQELVFVVILDSASFRTRTKVESESRRKDTVIVMPSKDTNRWSLVLGHLATKYEAQHFSIIFPKTAVGAAKSVSLVQSAYQQAPPQIGARRIWIRRRPKANVAQSMAAPYVEYGDVDKELKSGAIESMSLDAAIVYDMAAAQLPKSYFRLIGSGHQRIPVDTVVYTHAAQANVPKEMLVGKFLSPAGRPPKRLVPYYGPSHPDASGI